MRSTKFAAYLALLLLITCGAAFGEGSTSPRTERTGEWEFIGTEPSGEKWFLHLPTIQQLNFSEVTFWVNVTDPQGVAGKPYQIKMFRYKQWQIFSPIKFPIGSIADDDSLLLSFYYRLFGKRWEFMNSNA